MFNCRTCRTCRTKHCSGIVSRRGFLAGAGAAAAVAASEIGLFEYASSLMADEPKQISKAVVDVVYVRPPNPRDVSWPGGACDIGAQQAMFTKALRSAGEKLGVELRVQDEPIHTDAHVARYVERLKKSPPDGLIIGAMELFGWAPVKKLLEQRGGVPTIIHSHLSGFTGNLQLGRDQPGVLMAATQKTDWLETGVRMLAAIRRLREARILLTRGRESVHELGTRIVPCKADWQAEIAKARDTAESRAIAAFYEKNAKKIVEPVRADIVEAARQYGVLRRLMADHDCQGITLAGCLTTKPPCLAVSKLRDEGVVATCEGCTHGALGEMVSFLLFNRPAFIQDPSPNTIDNTLIGAHCTCGTRLEGCDKDYRAPFVLRNYHTRQGVSVQVLWPVGSQMTVIQFGWPKKTLMIGSGKVVSNIDQPPSGCCRTAVEITVDGCADTRDVKGFHQLFILGNVERSLRQFCKLAGIEASRIY